MSWKRIDRITAGAVFLYALVLYLLTVAPTASFWDAGEWIASVHGLEVMHPPGAPFYMLLGRLFSMFVPIEYVAFSVNLISVLASAATVLLTHLIIVRLVRAWQPPLAEQAPVQRISALVAGVIGACAFAATGSFWFNAVEAEVYALSMFFTAAVVWLSLRWSEAARAEEERLSTGRHAFSLKANRYLVLIAYLFGLAIGVHLLNLLALFFVALIIFFTEYERPEWPRAKRWKGLLAAGAASVAAFFVIYPGVILWLPTFAEQSGVPLFFFVFVFALVAFAVYYTQTRHRPALNLAALCLAMVLIGYSTYALIFIRSATDPPIDLNDPETVDAFVSYLKREQYGATPLLKGSTYDDELGRVNLQEEELFPRRWSWQPQHERVYARYDSDWEFFWDYQVGHMYLRYFLWNFSGRISDVQDAGWTVTGAGLPSVGTTPSEAASRNIYYALPLLLGLIGAIFHFNRDWRRALAVGVLFFITGLGIIVYLNQTPLQPRERDYSYVASFFAFSLWIGVGAGGLIELAAEAVRNRLRPAASRGLALGIGGLLFAAVPFNLVTENYFDHDRSGRYIAADYAYNMLMSVEENAILFTNGDNDTYPLWYLQEVMGVRTDVRVVNLSLLQTKWYIKQLKNQWANESAPLPISLTEEEIENLRPIPWQPQQVQIPVDPQHWLQTTDIPLADTSAIESPMTWTLRGRPYNERTNVLYVNDQVVYNMLLTNARNGWERPIYFAVTVAPDAQLDLDAHLQLEGMAMRVVPTENPGHPMGAVVPEVTLANLEEFRFRNLDDPDVYYDSVIRRMVDNYRNIFANIALQLTEQGLDEEARAVLDRLTREVPFDVIAGDPQSFLLVARAYRAADAEERATALLKRAEPLVLAQLEQARSRRSMGYAAQYVQLIRQAYLAAGDFEAAAALSDRLANILGNDSIRRTPQELRQSYQRTAADTAAAGGP